MKTAPAEQGFTLVEVMAAMVILAIAIVGVMGMFEVGDRAIQYGARATRAQLLVESRLEAKRTVPWAALLSDDLDGDGRAETLMGDEGMDPDEAAGDGVFSAAAEEGPIRLVWTVQPVDGRPLSQTGAVAILVRATYPIGPDRTREIRLGTLRANPRYLGERR